MNAYRSFGLFGLILLAFGIVGGLTGGVWNSIYVLVHLIGGTSMLALFLFTQVENLRESVSGRRTKYATNTIVYTLLFFAVVVMVNFMGARNPWRFDATEQGVFSLAPQTVAVLDGLDEDVEVLAFFRESEGLGAERLLSAYAAASGRFSFRMIDPDKRPEMTQQYEVAQYSTLVAVHGEDSTRITETSEEALTNALMRLAGAEVKRFYFTSGHGEPDLEARETPEGLGQLKAALENEGAEVIPLLLAIVPDVPGDAELLVIAGPQRPFGDSEIATLERYLDRGGRAWILIEPQMSEELLPGLAARGIVVGDDIVIDQVVQLFAGPSVGLEPVVTDYGFHPITQDFAQNTLFRMARSVSAAEEPPAGITVTELVQTSSSSWAESDLDLLFDTQEVSPEGDAAGPISLAVAVTLSSSALNWTAPATAPGAVLSTPAATSPPADLVGRMVVVGDAEWVSNSRLSMMFNEDLALNMVGWLTGGDEESLSIRPRARRSSRISLTEEQGWGVFYATVLLLPELVLLCGLMIWWRRRR